MSNLTVWFKSILKLGIIKQPADKLNSNGLKFIEDIYVSEQSIIYDGIKKTVDLLKNELGHEQRD